MIDSFVVQLFLVVSLAAYVVGPVRFPNYSRQVGYLVGDLVKVIRQSLNTYKGVSKDKDISKMSSEMKSGLQEIKKIQQQFDFGFNLIRSPSQAIRLATEKEEKPQDITKQEDVTTKTHEQNKAPVPLPPIMGGARYVSKTAFLIKQYKDNNPGIEDESKHFKDER